MLKRFIRIPSLLLLLLLALSACGQASQEGFPSESGYTDAQLAIGAAARFGGVVVSAKETKVQKDESKTLGEVKVAVGDVVKKGQVLFTYDGSQAQFDYEKASIELEQMRMSLDDYATQRADLEKEKKSAPDSEQLSYTIQIQEIDTSIRETTYNIGLKEKEVEKLKADTENLEVRSPSSGKIKAINLTEGGENGEGTVSSGDMSDASQPFIVISKSKAFRIKGYINEENMGSLAVGDPVTIRSRVDDTVWEGEVAQIETESPEQNQSGYYEDAEMTTSSRYPFYVDLKETDGLMLGQHVYIELQTDASFLPPEGDMEDQSLTDNAAEDETGE